MKLQNILSILSDCVAVKRLSKNNRSAITFGIDHLLTRIGSQHRESRAIDMSNGSRFHYRRNKGDLQSIREIWLEQHYRLPEWVRDRTTLLDLGGNIGMTTLWLAKEYGFSDIVVVEPDESNYAILERNFHENDVNVKTIKAAIGPTDGEICFAADECSNQGHISDQGITVPMASMKTVLQHFGDRPVDLIKMDIEGGEEFLVSQNCEWMDSINFVITELHPSIIDVSKVISAFADHGLTYYPGNGGKVSTNEAQSGNFMDMFVRESAI